MSKIMLILNPNSGKMKARVSLFEIIDLFTTHGNEVTVFPTKGKLDATNLVKTKSRDFDMVVCCGGDGTLNEVMDGLMQLEDKKPLGYIPTGTTNDFATSLRIPKEISKATMNIIQGHKINIDVGMFNDKYFTYIASFGMFTEISYTTSQGLKNNFGHFAYMLEGAKSVIEIPNFKVKIKYDGNVLEDDFVFGAVLNSTSIGGIVKIAPERVKLDDGLFEVILIKNPFNRFKLRNTFLGLSHQKYDPQYVQFFSTSQIEILSETDINWCLDGEFGGCSKEANIQNYAKHISIVSSIDLDVPL